MFAYWHSLFNAVQSTRSTTDFTDTLVKQIIAWIYSALVVFSEYIEILKSFVVKYNLWNFTDYHFELWNVSPEGIWLQFRNCQTLPYKDYYSNPCLFPTSCYYVFFLVFCFGKYSTNNCNYFIFRGGKIQQYRNHI